MTSPRAVSILIYFHTLIYGGSSIRGGRNIVIKDNPSASEIPLKEVVHLMRHVVYLTVAPEAEESKQYDDWTCTGALVTSSHIITSAACVEDVRLMYAVAAPHTYKKWADFDQDPCVKAIKKRVMLTCVLKSYEFSARPEIWSKHDIAVATVETPYDHLGDDAHYKKLGCLYAPDTAEINYNETIEEPNSMKNIQTKAVIGWGNRFRMFYPTQKRTLAVLPAIALDVDVLEKNICLKYYKGEISNVINDYMICVGSDGDTRGRGLCLHDHGAPLLGYLDNERKKAYVFGVGTAFLIKKQQNNRTVDELCVGPSLITSTARYKNFITCVIQKNHTSGRRSCHDIPNTIGVTKTYDWTNNSRP